MTSLYKRIFNLLILKDLPQSLLKNRLNKIMVLDLYLTKP